MNTTIKIIIKASDLKIALGHQGKIAGCGIHKDKRTKRNRTRSNKTRKLINEWN